MIKISKVKKQVPILKTDGKTMSKLAGGKIDSYCSFVGAAGLGCSVGLVFDSVWGLASAASRTFAGVLMLVAVTSFTSIVVLGRAATLTPGLPLAINRYPLLGV